MSYSARGCRLIVGRDVCPDLLQISVRLLADVVLHLPFRLSGARPLYNFVGELVQRLLGVHTKASGFEIRFRPFKCRDYF